MKKFYLKYLFVAMTMLLCSVAASAYDFWADSIFYNVTSDKTVAVTYPGDFPGYPFTYPNEVITIPEKVVYNGVEYSVTSIGEHAFFGCILKTITIPESVTNIGESAFSSCYALTNVIIPESVTGIGECAFNSCYALTNVTIPESVTSIENATFCYCPKLRNIAIPESVTSIGEDAFSACTGLRSIIIGNGVTYIGDRAFDECTGLTSIYLLGETPPSVGYFTDAQYVNIILYVPTGSLVRYQADPGWNYFTNIVEFDPTGIEDVAEEDVPAFEVTAGGIQLTSAEDKVVAVYSVGGALIEKISSYAGEEITLGKGVYIVRVGDKAVKVRL